ncbi:AEC family transporter [Plantibacter sp. Mn2098]|uniref:AEC family transporter n=1 Tax=Plantibacter sp. Mn2098 TaxID=3395266 RepID=UPI003BE2048D
MGGVLTGFAIIGVVILVGYIAGRLEIGGPTTPHVLNRVAFFVTNPALLFTVLVTADLHEVFSDVIWVAFLSALATAALFVLVNAVWLHRPVPVVTIGALASSYVNANNIGIPVAVYVLGSASYVAPVILLQLLIFAPIGLTILDAYHRGSVSFVGIVTQPFRNPMIIASLAGLVLNLFGVRLPTPVMAPFELLGGAAVPLILMAFGMSLHGMRPLRPGSGRREILVGTVLKAVGMPVVAFLIAHFGFGLVGAPLFASVVLASLPTAQNVYNFATRYEQGEPLARDVVLLTTILAVPVLLGVAALLA